MNRIRPLAATVLLFLIGLPGIRAQEAEARDDFNFAAGLHDKGFHDRAATALSEFVKKWPTDARVPKARFYLGQSLAEVGKDAEALPHFLLYLKSGDTALALRAELRCGELLHRLGKSKEALPHLKIAAESTGEPALVAAGRYFLGEAALASGNAELARTAYEGLAMDFPKDRYAPFAASAIGFLDLKAGDFEAAVRRFQSAVAAGAEGELAAEARCMIGEGYLRGLRFADAEAAFQDAIQKGPMKFEVDARAGLSEALAAQKKGELAIGAASQLAERCPEAAGTVPAMIRIASRLHDQGLDKDGLRILELIRAPKGQESTDVSYWRGVLLGGSGDKDAALDELRRSVAKEASPRRKFTFAEALAEAGKHEEALALYLEIRKGGKDPELLHEVSFAEAFAENRLGRFARALPLLESILRGDASKELKCDAAFAIAENLFSLGKFEEAKAAYGRVLADPSKAKSKESIFKRGMCAYQLKQYDAALADFEALVAEGGPESLLGEARFLIGKCHEGAGRIAEARRAFLAAAKAGGKSGTVPDRALLGAAIAARREGDKNGAVELARRAVAAASTAALRGEALFVLAESLQDAAKPTEAEAVYRDLVEKLADHPRVASARLGLAWALRDAGRHEDALAAAAALAAEVKDTAILGEARYLAGLEAVAANDPLKAIGPLTRLVNEAPSHARAPEAALLLGTTFAKLERSSEAESVLRVLVEVQKKSPLQATALLEWAYVLDSLNRPSDRDRAFSRVVVEYPESEAAPEALFRLGESAYERKAFAEALAFYDRLVASTHGKGFEDKALYKSGWCQRQLGKHREAAALFEKVQGLEKSDLCAEAAYLAGEAHEVLGEVELAEKSFREVARLRPGHELAPDAELRAVLALAALGRPADVVKAAPRVLSKHGALPRALRVRSAFADALYDLKQWGRARTAYKEVVLASEGELGARAQFRIGLAWRSEANAEKALDDLLKVTILYAHAEWVGKASLAAGEILEELGAPEKARKIYEDLVKSHPDHDEAKTARKRLKSLERGKGNEHP